MVEGRRETGYSEVVIDVGGCIANCRRAWWKIAILAIAAGSGAFGYTLTMPNRYQSEAVIAPVGEEGKQNPVLGALSSFGIISGGPAKIEELESLFKSKELTVRVFRKHALWPVVSDGEYDPATGKVRPGLVDRLSGGGTEPRIPGDWDAIRSVKDKLSITTDKKAGTLSLSFESRFADGSAKIVALYLDEGKSRLQEEALERAGRNKKFIEEQLSRVNDTLTRDKLYSLYGQEIEKEMMARNREQFGFRVIDPPRMPDRKSGPSRGLAGITGGLIGMALSAVYYARKEK